MSNCVNKKIKRQLWSAFGPFLPLFRLFLSLFLTWLYSEPFFCNHSPSRSFRCKNGLIGAGKHTHGTKGRLPNLLTGCCRLSRCTISSLILYFCMRSRLNTPSTSFYYVYLASFQPIYWNFEVSAGISERSDAVGSERESASTNILIPFHPRFYKYNLLHNWFEPWFQEVNIYYSPPLPMVKVEMKGMTNHPTLTFGGGGFKGYCKRLSGKLNGGKRVSEGPLHIFFDPYKRWLNFIKEKNHADSLAPRTTTNLFLATKSDPFTAVWQRL